MNHVGVTRNHIGMIIIQPSRSTCRAPVILVRNAQKSCIFRLLSSQLHAIPPCCAVQVIVIRLLFLSVLVMAIYTLVEAGKCPEVADVVAGRVPIRSTPVSVHSHAVPPPVEQSA